MEVLAKGIMISAAVVVAAVAAVVQWWQFSQVPERYSTHGERPRRN